MTDYELHAVQSLGDDINKPHGEQSETKQGVVSEKFPELTLKMKDEDIIKLTSSWKKEWDDSSVKTKWLDKCKENEEYWLGKQFTGPTHGERAMIDNLIFESIETFLPQATRRNPEPIVSLHSSVESDETKEVFVTKVKERLADLSDENKLRLKLKKIARHWTIYQLGVGKIGWDLDNDTPTLRVLRPQKIILDPKATITDDGYTGAYIGEYRKMEAGQLLRIIDTDEEEEMEGKGKDAVKHIKKLVEKDKATEVQFIEWSTPQYVCWTLGDKVLFKKKNLHWNYDKTEQEETVDDFGTTEVKEVEKLGINHFQSPKMPYIFLSIFNLGDQPMDSTGLVQQNLSNQDLINKRNRQIDKNADSMNGGMIISAERSGLDKEQAKQASRSLRKGHSILIPTGAPSEAVMKLPTPGLPADIYNQLQDIRARMRDIFGVKGSSQAGLSGESTVRGKIVSRNLDTDRIGGGVTEYLEQFADDVYNWFVQMLYVYDDNFQFIEGAEPPRLVISVKEGSLLPKDSTTIANQAIELANAGKMSTVDLYKRLEYPNPEDLAANAWLEVNAPQILFKDNPLVQEAMNMQAQAMAEKVLPGEPQTGGQPLPGEETQVLNEVPIQ